MLNKKMMSLLVAGMVSLSVVGCEDTSSTVKDITPAAVEEEVKEDTITLSAESIVANVKPADWNTDELNIYEMSNEEGKLVIKLGVDYTSKESYMTFGECDSYTIIQFLQQNNLLEGIDRIVISLVHPEDGSLYTTAVFNKANLEQVNFDMKLQPIYKYAESVSIMPALR